MHAQTWDFKLREAKSQYQKAKDMIVHVTHTGERNDMIITITGKKAHMLFDPTTLWELTPVDTTVKAKAGMIAMSNTADTWARVYSRGLYADTCPTL
jgi:hypothetical protein